jgi:hypothetical protein
VKSPKVTLSARLLGSVSSWSDIRIDKLKPVLATRQTRPWASLMSSEVYAKISSALNKHAPTEYWKNLRRYLIPRYRHQELANPDKTKNRYENVLPATTRSPDSWTSSSSSLRVYWRRRRIEMGLFLRYCDRPFVLL